MTLIDDWAERLIPDRRSIIASATSLLVKRPGADVMHDTAQQFNYNTDAIHALVVVRAHHVLLGDYALKTFDVCLLSPDEGPIY